VGLAGISVLVGVAQLQSGTAAAPSFDIVRAVRGDVIVTVGGVGRIVEAGAAGSILVPSATGGSAQAASGGGGVTSVPAGSVFPRVAGHIASFRVRPGQRVVAGQAIAVLDDGGASRIAVAQASNELEMALLELRQKQTSDPQKGVPATAEELAAGELTVRAAQRRLARLFVPARPAEVSAARLELTRAQADLAALSRPPSTPSPETLTSAKQAVSAAKARLARLFRRNPAEIAAARAEIKKASADLAALRQSAPGSPKGVAAALEALTAAQRKLEKLQAPVNPADLAQAEADRMRAQSDLETLRGDPTAVPAAARAAALSAAEAQVVAADLKLAKLRGPVDPAELAVALSELRKAEADLALNRKTSTTPEAFAAAEQAIRAATQKLAQLQKGPDRADVAIAQADVRKAEAELASMRAPSRQTFEAARQAVRSARAKLTQLLGPPLRADVSAAKLEIEKAQADLAVLKARGGPASPNDVAIAELKARAAQLRLDAARNAQALLKIRSPWTGTVTSLDTVRGAPVDPSTPVATIADLSRLGVSVDLSEFDVAQVKPSMPAVVRVDALGGKAFSGRVVSVPYAGNENGGVVTFPVRVLLSRQGNLKLGMNVSVRIIVAKRKGVVNVPVEAVTVDDEDRPTVTIAGKDGQQMLRPVKTGLANNKSIEITKGVRLGEQLVVGGGEDEE
jgi:RND family efflux transporter MFP subunit